MSSIEASVKPISRNLLPHAIPVLRRGTANETISFYQQSYGLAFAVQIKNRHGANRLDYRFNSPANDLDEIPAGGVDNIDDTWVDFLQLVITGGAGSWIVKAQVVPIDVLIKLGILK